MLTLSCNGQVLYGYRCLAGKLMRRGFFVTDRPPSANFSDTLHTFDTRVYTLTLIGGQR